MRQFNVEFESETFVLPVSLEIVCVKMLLKHILLALIWINSIGFNLAAFEGKKRIPFEYFFLLAAF